MLPIFAAAIVGGIGNPFGAFLGGYVIAFAEIFLTYAAIILTFLGAVHWGAAIYSNNKEFKTYVWSVTPAISSWIILMGFTANYILIVLFLILCFAMKSIPLGLPLTRGCQMSTGVDRGRGTKLSVSSVYPRYSTGAGSV